MAKELQLASNANSLHPLAKVSIINKVINLSLRPIDLAARFTHPTLFNVGLFFCISNISISISFTGIADGFIRHYKSSVYPPWLPCLGSRYFFFSFLSLLFVHNKHCRLNVFSWVFLFFGRVLDDNEK